MYVQGTENPEWYGVLGKRADNFDDDVNLRKF